MKRIMLALCVLLTLFSSAEAQQKREPAKNKVGAIHLTHSGGSYRLQSSSDNTTLNESVVGAGFFYDRVFFERFTAGVKYGAKMERNLSGTISGKSVVVKEAVTLIGFDFKGYFDKHRSPGFKPYLGVGFGNITAKSTITTITDVADSPGTTSDSSTKAVIPYTSLSAGIDLVYRMGGMALDAALVTGKTLDLKSNSTYFATYEYAGLLIGISVYTFF